MPDENNQNTAGTGENSNANADQNQANANDTGNENASSQGDGGDGGSQDNKADEGKNQEGDNNEDNAKAPDSEKEEEEDKGFQDDDAEPEVRKRMSPKDFIIQRQKKKIEKMEKKEAEEKNEDEDDDEIAPEDEALITKVVSKQFAPVFEKTAKEEDDKEVKSFLEENPDFKPYEAKARRYLSHPSRRHLPVSAIFYEVAGTDLLKIGAKRGKEADQEADDTQTGGGSAREKEGEQSVWDLTPEEFAAKQQKLRHG